MIKEIPREKMSEYLSYFSDHKYFTILLEFIPFSDLGKGYTDNLDAPEVILFTIGEGGGESYLSGDSRSMYAKELLDFIPERNTIFITDKSWVLPFREKWENLTFGFGVDYSSVALNLDNIRSLLKNIPYGFSLERLDKENVNKIEENLPIHYSNIQIISKDIDEYITKRIGFCLKDNDKVVSIASSAFPFQKKLEILVETCEGYKKKGLATIVCAKLIEYCLQNNIDPHWNTNIYNPYSMKLAKKLGFTDLKYYKIYSWSKDQSENINDLRKAFLDLIIGIDIVEGMVESINDESLQKHLQTVVNLSEKYAIMNEKVR
ncbi:MAG: GNAT family N-acetyltransferase [Candidatus Hodarchaeota archaeon]